MRKSFAAAPKSCDTKKKSAPVPTEALLEVGIDRYELQSVVKGKEDIGDDDVAYEEAHDEL